MNPLPCPFCATAMHQHKHCFSHPWPTKGDCLLRHYSFDNNKIGSWNSRAAQGIETRSAETERLSPKGESSVAESDAPSHDGAS
jgi:hypothetical protein